MDRTGRCVDATISLFPPPFVRPRHRLRGILNQQPRCKMKRDKTCSATNRLITAKDHASLQINVGHLDANGIYTGQFTTFALCGFVRAQGDADSGLDRLWQKKKAELRQQ